MDAITAVRTHLVDRTQRMREAQAVQAQRPRSRNAKATAEKHGEAFIAIYMLALDLMTPEEVIAIVKEADEEAAA